MHQHEEVTLLLNRIDGPIVRMSDDLSSIQDHLDSQSLALVADSSN